MRVEFDLRESLNAHVPDEPILFTVRLSSVRVEFDLRDSLNAFAPDGPIEFPLRPRSVRVEFDFVTSYMVLSDNKSEQGKVIFQGTFDYVVEFHAHCCAHWCLITF